MNKKNNLNVSYRCSIIIFFILIIGLSSKPAYTQPQYEVTTTKYLLGTQIDITAIHSDIDSMKKAMYFAFKEIERIQSIMSVQIDTTEVSGINHSAGISPHKVSWETYSIISRSIEYSKKYNGIFDITIGPISDLWGFSSDKQITSLPDKKIIDSLIKLVDYKKIKLDPSDTSVFLQVKGMKIDLGGIAKGYAIDRASDVMKKYGMKNFFVNGGGDIYVSGRKSPEQKWKIGIKDPRDEKNIIANFEVSDMAVGTSGDYERFVIIDGKRYHHIFDTKTGYPVMISESGTALASSTEEAVVLSKIVFIKGSENIISPEPGYEIIGVVVSANGQIFYNEPMKSMYNFSLINK